MSWAARRRLLIVLVILVVVGMGVFYKLSPIIFQAPMCTDGTQNGTETGIDCGGSCTNLCGSEVKVPTVLWARSFAVTDSVYNAIAYVENKNDAATRAIPYEFRLYDSKGIFVARVGGTAIIPPLGRYAIVETGIQAGETAVERTTFQFASTPAPWERITTEVATLKVSTGNIKLDTSGAIPRLSASVTNPSPTVALHNTVVAAILYDKNDNAVNVSRTFIPILAPGTTSSVFFTWPRALGAEIVRYELVPIIDVFNTQ